MKNAGESILEFEATLAGSPAHAQILSSMALVGEWERVPSAKPRLSVDAQRWMRRFATVTPESASERLEVATVTPESASERLEVEGADSMSASVAAGIVSAVVSQGVDTGADASTLTADDDNLGMRCAPCGSGLFKARFRELCPWDLDDDGPWEEGQEMPSVKPLRHPTAPTTEERLAHEASHLPYRSWCRSCVAGRGRDVSHPRAVDRSEDGVPVISFDYGYMGDEKRLPDGTLWSPSPILVAVDSQSRYIGAWIHRGKGPGNPYNVKTLKEFITTLGYSKVTLKCDQENSIQSSQGCSSYEAEAGWYRCWGGRCTKRHIPNE